MRIITWNCNGAFRKTVKSLDYLNTEIYVIKECENPAVSNDIEYKKFASNYRWVGNKNKGLGIFAKDSITLMDNHWKTYGLEWFISCRVNDEFTLVAVWGSGNYIEDIYVYLQIHYEKLNSLKKVLICGDFNSNSIWDKKNKRRTHSAVVQQLQELNLYSYYHLNKNEPQGKESTPTFYLYRNQQKPYHIDYCFGNKNEFSNLKVGKFEDWIKFSDHMPIVFDLISYI